MAVLYAHSPGRLPFVPRDNPARADYILDYHYAIGHPAIYRIPPPEEIHAESAWEIRDARLPWDPNTVAFVRFLEEATVIDRGRARFGNAILIFEENPWDDPQADGPPPSHQDDSQGPGPHVQYPSQHLQYPTEDGEIPPEAPGEPAQVTALMLEQPPVSYVPPPPPPLLERTVDPRLGLTYAPQVYNDTRTAHDDFGTRLAALAHEACRRLDEMHPGPAPSPDDIPDLVSDREDTPDTEVDELMSSGDDRVAPPLATGPNRHRLRPRLCADGRALREARAIAANLGRRTRRVSVFRTEAPTLALRLTEREELDNLLNVKPSLWLPHEQQYVQDLTNRLMEAANGLVEARATIALGGAGNMVGIEAD